MDAKWKSGASMAAQCARLLDALRRGPVSCIYAREALDIFQPNTRITDLRQQGCEIRTRRERVQDQRGNWHYVGVWSLISEPTPAQQSLNIEEAS